ncbi:MAG TPA: hypothetical protein VHD83_27650 [Puia sp.]|nr:hypothetical protein [Puia sp.]
MYRNIFVILLLISSPSFAQDSTARDEKTQFVVGVTGNSALNYYGRVDSLQSKGLYPFAGVNFGNGLYVNANFVFIHNALQSEYAATLIEGGYNFHDQKNTWAGNISTVRYFYRDNTDLIQSTIKQSVAVSITQLNKIVNITIGGDLKFGSQADPGAQAGLDHIVKFVRVIGKGVIVLDPSVYVYAGTQHFTQTYLQQQHFLLLPAGEDVVTKDSRAFSILSYEGSMPMILAYNKFQLILTPAYVLPQHVLTGNALALFYTTATLKFTL